jgi:putative flippase GtrA
MFPRRLHILHKGPFTHVIPGHGNPIREVFPLRHPEYDDRFRHAQLLILAHGHLRGVRLAPINLLGVLFALTNRYLLNKHWTFRAPAQPGRRVGRFVLVSLIGVSLNTTLVVALTHGMMRPAGITPQLWEDLAKALATVAESQTARKGK